MLHMQKHQILNPSVMIDASHDNCLVNGKKNHRLQPKIVLEIIEGLRKRPDLRKLVKGFMVESYLKEGCQSVDIENPRAIDLLAYLLPILVWVGKKRKLSHTLSDRVFE